LGIHLEDLIEISKTRLFDPKEEFFLTTLELSTMIFIERLKQREYVEREIEELPEEEDEKENAEEDEEVEKLHLYNPPKYFIDEERNDEALHLEEEEDEEKKHRIFVLLEESELHLKKRFDEYKEEKSNFHFPNETKHM
jgi:hypothetical protein